MIKPLMTLTGLILTSLILSAPAAAQTTGLRPGESRLAADQARADRQAQRVDAGVAAGSINRREAARLDRRQAGIERGTTRLAADGRYSRTDAARIDRRQDASSRNIARARRNQR